MSDNNYTKLSYTNLKVYCRLDNNSNITCYRNPAGSINIDIHKTGCWRRNYHKLSVLDALKKLLALKAEGLKVPDIAFKNIIENITDTFEILQIGQALGDNFEGLQNIIGE